MDSEIKFSIVFPTRERPELLEKLMTSVLENTRNLSEVEVLIAIDEDDNSYNHLKFYSCFKVFRVKRSLNFSQDYYTFLAHQSKGKWIIAANDDCCFETMDWDVIAYDILKDLPNTIYGWCEDGLGEYRAKGHGNYCCFPLQGRKGFEALGFIFPARIPTWGADIWCKNIYDAIDSVVYLPIKLIHYNYHNFTREQDKVSIRIAENQVAFDVRPHYSEVNALLASLRKELNNE